MVRIFSFTHTWFIAGIFVASTALVGWDQPIERLGSTMGGSISLIQEASGDPQKLLQFQLSEIYFAKEQLIEKLPEWAERTKSMELRQVLEQHRKETAAQLDQLRKAYGMAGGGVDPEPTENAGFDALIKDGDMLIDRFDGSSGDGALASVILKIEFLEIACYTGAIATARQVETEDGLLTLLEENMKEDEAMAQIIEKIFKGEATDIDAKGEVDPKEITPDADGEMKQEDK